MRTKILMLLVCLAMLAGCERKMSVSVSETARVPEVEVAADRTAKASALVQYSLVSGTSTATRLPENETVQVELQLGKASLNGRPVKLSYSVGEASKVQLSEDKRGATWQTKVTQPGGSSSTDLSVTATLGPDDVSALKCNTRVALTIETQWKVTQPGGSSWELEPPTSGVKTETTKASVRCEAPLEAPPPPQTPLTGDGGPSASSDGGPDGG